MKELGAAEAKVRELEKIVDLKILHCNQVSDRNSQLHLELEMQQAKVSSVYCVFEDVMYEGETLIAIFATEDAADTFAKDHNASLTIGYEYIVRSYEVKS